MRDLRFRRLEQHCVGGMRDKIELSLPVPKSPDLLPWIARHEWHGQKLEDFPNLKDWYDRIWAREPVRKGFEVP